MDKCQFLYKKTSKRFVESIFSIEAVKTEVIFTSLDWSSPTRSTFEILDSSLLKIFSSILCSLLKNLNLSFEKLGQWRMQWIVALAVPQLQIGFNVSWKLCWIYEIKGDFNLPVAFSLVWNCQGCDNERCYLRKVL